MVAPTLRIERRPKGTAPRQTLTAASEPVAEFLDTRFKSTMGGNRSQDWQTLAWEMYDRVGELRYYVGWRASSCSRVRLIASSVDMETGKATGNISDKDPNGPRVKEIVRGIANGPLGQSQLVKRIVESLSVVGEVWVAILDTKEDKLPDGSPRMMWQVVTREEVRTSGTGSIDIELETGERHPFDPTSDSLFRIWNPRARRASEPDSPVRACLDPLHEIVRTTKTISNASKSRLIGNGVVFVPQEMSLPATQGPTSDKTGIAEQTAIQGTPAVKQLQELLWQVATTAYDDDDSMAALIPMFAAVPGDQVKNVNHLKFDNSVTSIAIQVRNDAISRLAMGLDVSPERLLGLGSNTNHWTAWQISDEDVALHVAPVMEMICQALTERVVNQVLIKEGLDPSAYTLWYDASGLVADPDKSNAANAAWMSGAICGQAYLELLGLPSGAGYDFDTMEGWQQWARDQVSRQPALVQTFLPLLGPKPGTLPIDSAKPPGLIAEETGNQIHDTPPMPLPAPGQPQTPSPQPAPAKGSGSGSGRGRRKTMQASAATATMLAERMLVTRALELAGKRRRRREDYVRLRDIPMHDTHKYMPPVAPEDVPRLIQGWDSALADEVIMRLGIDTEELRAAVYEIVKRELVSGMVEGEVE